MGHTLYSEWSTHILLDAFQSARRDVVERLYQELRAAGGLADEARFEVARKMTEVCGGKGWGDLVTWCMVG